MENYYQSQPIHQDIYNCSNDEGVSDQIFLYPTNAPSMLPNIHENNKSILLSPMNNQLCMFQAIDASSICSSSSSCSSSPVSIPTHITINTSNINPSINSNNFLVQPQNFKQFPSPPTSPSSQKQLSSTAQSPTIKQEKNIDEDYDAEVVDDDKNAKNIDDGIINIVNVKQEQNDTIVVNNGKVTDDDDNENQQLKQLDYLSINPKQRNRILKRRTARERFEKKYGFSKQRKPYIHESRHVHALRRPRGPGGRFLNANQMAEIERRNSMESVNSDSSTSSSSISSGNSSSNNETLYSPIKENIHSPIDNELSFGFINADISVNNNNNNHDGFYNDNNNNINANVHCQQVFIGEHHNISEMNVNGLIGEYLYHPDPSSLSIQTQAAPIIPSYHSQQSFHQIPSPCSPIFQEINDNNNSYLLPSQQHFDQQQQLLLFNNSEEETPIIPSSQHQQYITYTCDNQSFYHQ